MNANLNLNWQIYRELNPDLIKANLNNEHQVTTHWTRYGQKENRKSKITDITPNFNWEIYKKQNPKLILRDQTEYELHWIKFGMEKCCNKIIENEIIENNAIDDKTIENEIKIITARTDEINEFNAKYGSREHKLRYHNSNKYNENYINRHNETNIIIFSIFLYFKLSIINFNQHLSIDNQYCLIRMLSLQIPEIGFYFIYNVPSP